MLCMLMELVAAELDRCMADRGAVYACRASDPEVFNGAGRAGLERKNGWTLAEQAGEVSPDGMQRLLRRADWDVDGVRDDVRDYVMDKMLRELLLTFYSKGFLSIQASANSSQRKFAVTLRETAALFCCCPRIWPYLSRHLNRGKGVPDDSRHPDPGASGWHQELEADAFAVTIVELVMASS
jgi:hypothetical protein